MNRQHAKPTGLLLSVVVPVYNGAETLGDCLAALCNQTLPADQYEILVIDDGSTDETPDIVASFAQRVRSHRIEPNAGRLIARRTGAELAACDDIVFCDSRVICEPDVLAVVLDHPHRPLMLGSDFPQEYFRTLYGRFLFSVYRKLWKPYFPQEWFAEQVEINQANFNRMPKGTGFLATDRSMFLRHQPTGGDRYVSDDTLLLAGMVTEKPIIRCRNLRCRYRARTELKAILPHLHFRGVLFNSFYLRPGHMFFWLYLALWAILLGGVILTATAVAPWWLVPAALLVGLVASSVFLADRVDNFLAVLVVLPPAGLCLASGIFRGQLIGLCRGLRRLLHRLGRKS